MLAYQGKIRVVHMRLVCARCRPDRMFGLFFFDIGTYLPG